MGEVGVLSLPLPSGVTDLRGRTFGRLKVREFAEIRNSYAYWSCDCECGTTGYVVRGKNLIAWEKAGRAISCSCYKNDPLVRRAARLTMPEEDRKSAASGKKLAAPKPAPKPRPPKVKRILPFIGDRAPVSPAAPPEPAPVQSPHIAWVEETQTVARPTPAPSPHVAWVAITKDRHGGYRVVVRLHRANNTSVMTSRRLTGPSDARREARRIFGDALHWLTGEQAGLHNQPWVMEIAELHISGGMHVA